MLAKKKKLSKKEIQEDKLVTGYYEVVEYLEKFKQQIIIGLAVVAAIVVAVVVYSNRQETKSIAATTELSRVIPLVEKGEFQKAIDGEEGTTNVGLKKIVEEYSGVEQGEIAKIYLGNAEYNLGNIDEALDAYSSYSGSLPLFKASSLAGQAACFESKKQYEDAAKSYNKAANVSKTNAANSQYLLNAGINYSKAGNKDKAKEIFESIKKDYASSAEARNIDRYIASLNI